MTARSNASVGKHLSIQVLYEDTQAVVEKNQYNWKRLKRTYEWMKGILTHLSLWNSMDGKSIIPRLTATVLRFLFN